MKKEIECQGHAFTVKSKYGSQLEIVTKNHVIYGYVGVSSRQHRQDLEPHQFFCFQIKLPNRTIFQSGLTLDEAVEQCCQALIEEEKQRDTVAAGRKSIADWFNRMPRRLTLNPGREP